jgi:hypothetical protein
MTDNTDYRPKHKKEIRMDDDGVRMPGRRELVRLTLDENGEPTSKTVPKVKAAAAGGSIGAALAVIVIWGIEYPTGVDIPIFVEGAIQVVFVASFTGLAGWLKRP